MYRYIAIFSQHATPRFNHVKTAISSAVKARPGQWETVYTDANLLIMHQPSLSSGMSHHLLSCGSGAILGYLFHSDCREYGSFKSSRAPQIIEPNESRKISSTQTHHLINNYWGWYVALVKNTNNDLVVLRSPAGSLPCYHYSNNGIHVFFSDPSFVSLFDKSQLQIDWELASCYLNNQYMQTHKTPVKNLIGLLPGQSSHINGNRVDVSSLWNPKDYYYNPLAADINELSCYLDRALLSCLESWASVFTTAVLRLSGGFDSSLLAGCMASFPHPPNLVCLTYYHPERPEDDEREYARLTAKRAGLQYVEEQLCQGNFDLNYYHTLYQYPFPFIVNPDFSIAREISNIAQRFKANVIISGDGGDGLFGALGQNAAAQDYAFENGFTRDTLNIAMRSAQISNTSVWVTLRKMIQARSGYNFHSKSDSGIADPANWGLNKDIIDFISRHSDNNYLGQSISTYPPGKYWQMLETSNRYSYYSSSPLVPELETIRPLLSQPLVELCLRIPYYVHQFNGRERGLARAAFAKYLPDPVRLRQFKTQGGSSVYDIISNHRTFFSEFLLDGVLAARGYLDKSAIEALRRSGEVTPEQYVRVAHLASVEAWARKWE